MILPIARIKIKVNLEFGQCVRQRRRELKLTQDELGKQFNWGKSQISRLELGGHAITLPMLVLICNALVTTPNRLLGFEPPDDGQTASPEVCRAMAYFWTRLATLEESRAESSARASV